MSKFIFDGSIFHVRLALADERGRGWHDLRGLVTGHFSEFGLRYCREGDEASQRALWEIFGEDITAAAVKHNVAEPWGCKFDV